MMLLNKLKRIDWAIVGILFVLMAASTFIVYSAVHGTRFEGTHVRHLFFYGLGFFVLLGASLVNYRLLIKYSTVFYVLGVGSLVAVYFFGAVINGARGWFIIPGIEQSVQPAEFAKLFIILMVAYVLARKAGEPLQLLRDVIPVGLIVFIPFVWVVIQPDLGNAIIYVVILVGMLWIANVKYLHVLLGIAIAAGGVYGGMQLIDAYHDPIERFLEGQGADHWMDRIDAFLYPEQATANDTWQIDNSVMAIGSGALFGEGYMQGTSVHTGRVPYTYSDSIFVVVGEEFGFMGASALLLLYFLLIYRLILISIQSGEAGGSYVIIGIVSMFVFQIFQNIGMFIGILPLTGITLPFVSYGGSSLLINMLSVGLALSIRVHADQPLEDDMN
ncbi:FtsW/RodA/SpoVE family cell cycle protein [Paenibacillus sp.]|uniref:FtsW/RodA/SpoVE family cell cycle protein n=1 Tax=Paenibacillus sp. TaxID=58172 RepID=UPI002D5E3E23|nr:FtsW/RodA/SpoVE family cell cycle protein [Paenibacillus sp.]HZG58032.1 FtsW/RodA/SpoVE family cell cycle protein [Paenibacillus sp.]